MRCLELTGPLLVAAALAWAGLAAEPLRAQTAAPMTGGARLERESFTYQRRIPRGEPGVSVLRLDLQAIAHSRLADIRVVTSDGHQVPYLLEADDAPLRIELAPLVVANAPEIASGSSLSQGRGRTVYTVTFPLSGMPPCDLVIETTARVFERELSLLVLNDDARGRDAGRWQTAAWASWRHTDPDTPAAPLVLPLPALGKASARLLVDEGDNQPLPVGHPAVHLQTRRLRFIRETGDELWLVYGKPGLTAPRYDLALIEPRMRTAEARDVAAEPETGSGGTDDTGRSRTVFWVALIVAVATLLAVVARLLMTPPGH
jgi:hypothetical protein